MPNAPNITLAVNGDMSLTVSRNVAGNDGERDVTLFFVEQPDSLNDYVCRAEIEAGSKKASIPVIAKRFSLPASITGQVGIKLVYSDSLGMSMAKTAVTLVYASNGTVILPENDLPDGMAIVQAAVFAGAEVDSESGEMVFTNLDGKEVSRAALPVSSGGIMRWE